MSSVTPIAELYERLRAAPRLVTEANEVQPGDVFVAYQRNRPKHPLFRFIWNTLESISPALLNALVSLAIRLRLSIWLTEGRHRGNQYAAEALANGAQWVVVDNPHHARRPQVLLVKDVVESLKDASIYHRSQFKIPIIGVTGSNGKTTTKELITHILGTTYRTVATDGNSNSSANSARLIMSIKEETEAVVVEMGLIKAGELREACRVVQPTHGLITGIGYTHLDHLKTIEGVQAAKGELFEHLIATGGHIFLNLDDDRVVALVALAGNYGNVTTYGTQASAQVRGEVVGLDPFLRVRWYWPGGSGEFVDIQTRLGGAYNVHNVLAALAVGPHFNIPPETLIGAIERFEPVGGRSQVIQSGTNTILLDAFNANPTSMASALDSLKQLEAEHKVVILGEMLDLGAGSSDFHRWMIEQVRALNPTAAIFVGRGFRAVQDRSVGVYFNTAGEARRWYAAQKFENTTVLLKGSHGVHVERVVQL